MVLQERAEPAYTWRHPHNVNGLRVHVLEAGFDSGDRPLHHGPGRRDGGNRRRSSRPAAEIAANTWLPDNELRVYAAEYGRTGFQGELNHYRSGGIGTPEMQLYAGRTIDQPSVFISGASGWGSYQSPGALERMQNSACIDVRAAPTRRRRSNAAGLSPRAASPRTSASRGDQI